MSGVTLFASAQAAIHAAPPPVAQRVGIAIPDATRPFPVTDALAALLPFVGPTPRVVVGLGLHRRLLLHERPQSPWPVLEHDPDDVVDLSTADIAAPATLSRHLADQDLVLELGVVELHQYAGFSGGHKALAVGCAGRRTIDFLHGRDLVTAPGVEIGRLEGNPFRAAVDQLGAHFRGRWCLLWSGAGWLAGEPIATLAAVAAALDVWQDVPTPAQAAILTVRGTKSRNFYQASRAATYLGLSPRPPLVPGATLYLDAPCPEGLGTGDGERAFARVLGAGPAPWAHLLDGPAPVGGGTQRAIMLALLLRRHPLVVCGVDDPAPFRAVGIDAFRQPATELAPPDALHVPDAFHRLPRLGVSPPE